MFSLGMGFKVRTPSNNEETQLQGTNKSPPMKLHKCGSRGKEFTVEDKDLAFIFKAFVSSKNSLLNA